MAGLGQGSVNEGIYRFHPGGSASIKQFCTSLVVPAPQLPSNTQICFIQGILTVYQGFVL